MKKQNNNKGFSLVELIVSIAIIVVIAVPVFNAFVVSAKNSAKAVKIGEATGAAQNVFELIDVYGVNGMLNCGSNGTVKNVLKKTFLSTDSDLNKIRKVTTGVLIPNVTYGGRKYDAEIISSVSDVSVSKYNGQEIVQYMDVDGFYSQTNSNPDASADADCKTVLGVSSVTGFSKKRTIDVNFTGMFSGSNTIPDNVDVQIVFHYEYYKNNELKFSRDYTYYILSNYTNDKDNKVRVYICYYPYYDGEKDTVNINVSNNVNLKGEFVLIKQKTPGLTDNEIQTKEANLNVSMTVNVPAAYDLEEAKKILYTNAKRKIGTTNETVGSFEYIINKGVGMYKNSPVNDSLLKTSSEDGAYLVTVKIYPNGTFYKSNGEFNESYGAVPSLYSFQTVKNK